MNFQKFGTLRVKDTRGSKEKMNMNQNKVDVIRQEMEPNKGCRGKLFSLLFNMSF